VEILFEVRFVSMQLKHNDFIVDRAMVPTREVLEFTTQDVLLARQKLLTRTIEEFTQQVSHLLQQLKLQPTTSIPKFKCFACETYGGGHATNECAMVQEEV